MSRLGVASGGWPGTRALNDCSTTPIATAPPSDQPLLWQMLRPTLRRCHSLAAKDPWWPAKQAAAQASLPFIYHGKFWCNEYVGVGSGSTTVAFVEALAADEDNSHRHRTCVPFTLLARFRSLR